ncbi:bacteriocin fulvocin C-related protein [Actinokineospora sp. UTMC 2448]|uniref:bacteriocin fulvocin C-related protein n=1 Tax=Actinokineospora sp. UTMC 2448 TaxID=2268449 RepID=UPI0021642B63|nr:bacteriocin fulvocin C-related protein [Actinokineospora sp. UTMC 2448]UVS79640.1 hypothetical protein Actkin_03390 [Actinokineospora sp. UTMC 2448]
MTDQRWILAFDASCGKCRELSDVVRRACEGKLEVLALTDPDVVRWRTEALGPNPRWAPTLLRVRGERVRAWTGPAMALPLVRWLGVRSTVRVLQAIGEAREAAGGATEGMGRKQFLRLGAGAVAAAAILAAGRTPAFGASEADAAKAWAAANRSRLPQTYAEMVRHTVTYRRAIFAELPAAVRSAMWVEHIDKWARARGGLTREQADIVAAVRKIAATESTFRLPASPEVRDALLGIKERAIAEFGHADAFRLLAALGPDDPQSLLAPKCACNLWDDWCSNETSCIAIQGDCERTSSGCGDLWLAPCNGRCFN